MAPPPTTPQSNTLFKYFNRTPKSSSQGGSPSTQPTQQQSTNSNSNATGGTPNNKSPSGSSKSSKISKLLTPSTPTSTGNSHSKKRRPTEPLSAGESNNKRPRADDHSPGKEFREGSIVWAKLEGYPWWPGMIRGEEVSGGPFTRKDWTEFHVQFFDEPPSRAWIRKPDLKAYGGSHDGNVPPARSDPAWIEACKVADGAIQMSPRKRAEKYWVNFEIEGNDEEVEGSDVEEEDDKANLKETPKKGKVDGGRPTQARIRRRLKVIDSSEDDEKNNNEEDKVVKEKKSTAAKRNGRQRSRDESDEEYSPSPTKDAPESEVSESESDASLIEEEMPTDEDSDEGPKEKSSRSKKNQAASLPTTPKSSIKTNVKARLSQFQSSETKNSPKPSTNVNNASSDRNAHWPHLKLPFLQPDRIQDANRRPASDPNYNPRTLYVPKDFLEKLTPGLRQWWELKSQNYDTVLFFKVGKFYEFYHMDAVIAAEELSILYMRGDFAHSGFPEKAYSKFASNLVEKGYKVARIEQTETPSMMTERCKKIKPTKFDKVVKREICQISTRGVRYASFQDDAISNPFTPESVYLYGIVEKVSTNGPSEFGVCFVDTTIGIFHVGQFQDDRHCSRLRTLLSHYTPAQMLLERGKLTASTQKLLENYAGVRREYLLPESEFWGAQKVLKYLAEQSFFRDKTSVGPAWPENLNKAVSKGDSLGLTPEEGWELGIKGLGGVVWYLKHCLLDHDLLSMKRFLIYKPVDSLSDVPVLEVPEPSRGPQYMVIDGITLRNLDITEGSQTLLSVLDRCSTNFGKRLLRHWICMPLAVPDEISARLDAVEELMELTELTDKVIPMLKTLPDLERLLNKVHYLGSAHRTKNHPEGRAFFFEQITYSKNKISDLLSVIKGFKTCSKIIQSMQKRDKEIKSTLLSRIVTKFPSLEKFLENFDNAFDHQAAVKDGKIIPKDGVDEEYDNSKASVMEVNDEANAYLKEISKKLQCRVSYFGSDKKRFQLEVPDNVRVSKEFELSSSKKGFKRYYNAKTKGFLSTVLHAETVREEVLRDITRRIFEQFDKHRDTWKQAVDFIGTFDVLLSMAAFSASQEDMCRPSVIHSDSPFVNIVDGRHPCITPDNYIPNSCKLGSSPENESRDGTFVLLTGPNMGGKSTLMRQVGLLSVLAHMGCYVPASKCEMSVVDRIFTRIGANDNIGEGESTFFVEMSETSAILKHSTTNSLILIDELGRGTATYDGTAIAYAVSTALADKGSRTVFSTHYHTLVNSIEHLPSVQLGHMACMVENENEDDPTQEMITFLYKIVSGACPKSYGFNAARLAGIPDDVIRVAHRKAKEFEATVSKVDLFRNICSKIGEKNFSLKDVESLGI